MNRSLVKTALFCIMATTVTVGAGGCRGSKKQDAELPTTIKGLPVLNIKKTEVPESLDVVGTVRARTSAMVSARIPGTLSILHVREGDRVKKGQLLAKLEAQESTAQATAAEASIDEARRGLDEALAHRKLADATFARFKMLFEEQAVTRQEYETKQTQREIAHQGVARAEARLRQVQEHARAAGTMADYSKIIAPISGIITAKQAELGGTVFPGQPLLTIEDEGSYQLELAIPESYIGRVKPGTAVQLSLDALQKNFNAKVAEVVPSTDPGSRTFVAKVMLPGVSVRSGMFGRASVILGGKFSALLVPQKAVFERGTLTAVWVIDKDGMARMRLIKSGKLLNGKIMVISGLAEGESIVVDQVEKVREGVKIEQ